MLVTPANSPRINPINFFINLVYIFSFLLQCLPTISHKIIAFFILFIWQITSEQFGVFCIFFSNIKKYFGFLFYFSQRRKVFTLKLCNFATQKKSTQKKSTEKLLVMFSTDRADILPQSRRAREIKAKAGRVVY
jgi:hypothetical protein